MSPVRGFVVLALSLGLAAGAFATTTAAGAAAGIGIVSGVGAAAGLSGPGIMSGLATVGSTVGSGAVGGLAVLGVAPAVASVAVMNIALRDDAALTEGDRVARRAGRVSSAAGAVSGTVAGVPVAFGLFGLDGGWRWLAEIARWLLIAALLIVALAVLYRVAPDRDAPKFRWVSVGALVATLLWLLASVGFSLYVTLFGNYAKTYGALAGVVVLLLWLWITCYAILLGAEINAEAEQQTASDTTRGPEKPMGQRNAVKADSLPGSADEPTPRLGGRAGSAEPAAKS